MNYVNLSLEEQYTTTTEQIWRKKHGQVFTPLSVANLMVKWVTGNLSGGNLLDPALGLGIFFREAAQILSDAGIDLQKFQLDGFEIDTTLASITEDEFERLGISLNCKKEDFLLAGIPDKYDGIICNPPYIHFQEYKYSEALREEFIRLHGLEMNKLSNIYALFLVKALSLLKPGGRAAFIVPSDFLNADYGTGIKEFLLQSKALTHLLIFHPTMQIFSGFLTTSAILLFEKNSSDRLEIINVSGLDELPHVVDYLTKPKEQVPSDDLAVKVYKYTDLNPAVKWKHYYSDLKINLYLEKKPHLVHFNQFANVRRGIATGANEFFTLSKEEAEKHNIEPCYLSPCLSRASQLKHTVFEQSDFDELVAAGRNVFLLNLKDQVLDQYVENYIQAGERQGFHTRFLTRKRRLWYSMEPLSPADLLLKTFGRKHAVFVQNNTPVLNLTCFHGIYLNTLGQQYREAIFLYLQTNLARQVFEGQKRDYGSGLGKFEPNDIKMANILDFTAISPSDLLIVKEMYNLYMQSYRCKFDDSEKIIEQVEHIFLKYW